MNRRLQILFLGALLGVLTCVGLVLLTFLGVVAGIAYAAVVLVLLGVGGARARAVQERAVQERREAGRSCTCCTTSQHDPVTVLE